jgi:hypothetical protein
MRTDAQRAYDRQWHAGRSIAAKTRKIQLQNERKQRLYAQIWKYKSEHSCVDCGEDDPVVLDLDHVRDIKIDDVSNLVQHGWSWAKILTEIAKCEVRCANCHRRVTYNRRISSV